MNVLVTYAVEAEFAPWRKLRPLRTILAGGAESYQTRIGKATVDFVVTGMGGARARRGAEAAMALPYALCIAAGFAGALREDYKVGNVLAARAVRRMEQTEKIASSADLQRAACEYHAMDAGLFLTVDRVLRTAGEKRQASSLADAVDMESFETLSAARRHNLPALALRVVSDRYDEELPEDLDTTVDERGRVKMGTVLNYLAAHPLQLPALVRLGRHSRAAAVALAQFLEIFIADISSRERSWPQCELQEAAAL